MQAAHDMVCNYISMGYLIKTGISFNSNCICLIHPFLDPCWAKGEPYAA